MPGTLQEGLTGLGQFMTSPQMPVLAGQLGAAAMGPNQNTWQSMVGRVAADYGKSAIAAKEAQAQNAKAAQFQDWMKTLFPMLMAGGGLTADPLKGANEVKIGNDGQAVIKMNLQNQGNNGPAGATNPGQMDPKQAQPVQPMQQPTQAPQGFNPRLLPF